jgi:predicted  nucleic acid-binding Zn-ribbon protein
MASNLLGMLKEGKMKEALQTFNKKGDVLEKMLDSFLSQSSQSARDSANLLNFIQNVISQGLVISPELQKMLQEKYKKLEKHLSFSEELAIEKEEDVNKLSQEAQDFVKQIMDLRQQLEFMDSETAQEVLSAYEDLLELIGVES